MVAKKKETVRIQIGDVERDATADEIAHIEKIRESNAPTTSDE